jgi:opacity protein-like surface antigen
MKRFWQLMSALGLSLLLCGQALAQHDGPYLGAYLGVNSLATAASSDDKGSFNLEYDPALQGSVVLGWDLKPRNSVGEGRIEVEYARRSNQLNQVEFLEGKVKGDGKLTVDSLLLSTYGVYRNPSRWTPYFGGGVGAARITADALQVTGQPLANDDAIVFAYQLGVGVDFGLTNWLSLDLGYRFFGTTRPRLTEANGSKFHTEYLSNSAILGLRLGF